MTGPDRARRAAGPGPEAVRVAEEALRAAFQSPGLPPALPSRMAPLRPILDDRAWLEALGRDRASARRWRGMFPVEHSGRNPG